MKKHLRSAPFKIYNASAGSGKTHTLVKEYLKIALRVPKNFKNILAITFTNKAVNEMKERILESLFDFGLAEVPMKSQDFFQELRSELNISAAELKQKSDETLKVILHNYAYFDVSTIDKFTHRIIRTFAKDLRLPQNFEPIVDTDLLLDEAVSRVVQKAGSNEQLTKVLVEFAFEKIEDNRSWDVTFDLNGIGSLLFKENHAPYVQKLASKKLEDFLELKKNVAIKVSALEKEMMVVASEVLNAILKTDLQFEDFPYQTLPNHFKKFVDQKFKPSELYNNKLEESLQNGKILKSGIELPSDDFGEFILNSYLKLKKSIYTYSYLKNIYRNVIPLTVLNTIQQEVDKIGKERDQIPIFKFDQIISREIKDQPAPFIYERLGEKYRHYFIDEFQDTSAAQWNNLVPLIDNALASEGGSLFLVGDVKQAIYRWRGGKAEQLLNLVTGVENPFVVLPETKPLPVNYRSHEQIIKFNNDFFAHSCSHLNNQIYQTLFRDGSKQVPNLKKGGLVQMDFLKKESEKDINELYCEKVLSTIEVIRTNKYALKDVCILVRSNKKGVVLANYLTERNIPIISSESLLLKSSPKVRFLIKLLQFGSNNQKADLAYEILNFLSRENTRRHEFIFKNIENLERLLNREYNFSFDRIERLSVYDSLEYAIRQFDLVPTSDAYITFLMDFALEVEQREGEGVQSFLSYWEKKKEKLAIASSENIDALRIMTIHKAKGLEFPIVIFPFANEQIYKRQDKKMWAPANASALSGFEQVLLNEKEEIAAYGNEASLIFQEEKQKMELDALNVLYVALTRAEKALYIISEKKSSRSETQKIDRYSDLFVNYLQEKSLWSDEQQTYSFGGLVAPSIKEGKESERKKFQYHYSFKDRSGFEIVTTGGMLWDTERDVAIAHGNLIHYMMGLIETGKDVDTAADLVLRKGDVAPSALNEIRSTVNQIIAHPKLQEFFSLKYKVMNERDILTDTGKLLRPDRIVLNNKEATILDYKTGKKNPKHKEQIQSYSDALEQMGFIVKNKIIIYINEQINPEFI
jgi:ATP-dependent exoDNAse (exonuclease V) beta subunit